MILVNAIGCKESGARIVAQNLCKSYEGDEKLFFIVANTVADFPSNERVKLLALSHPIFGRLLRPMYEVIILVISLTPWVKRVVNLSNYGLCFWSKQTVYFQNANLLEKGDAKFETGKSNIINRYLLKTCAKNAHKIVVQTAVVKRKLESVFGNALKAPVEICLPKVDLPEVVQNTSLNSTFQGIYPTTNSEYKRNDLAIGAYSTLKESHALYITISGESVHEGNVKKVGFLSQRELAEYYSKSDFLLFTSEVESLGIPLIESLSLGLPAVLPELDYSKEIYGDAAEYFSSFDSQSIAEAIIKLEENYAAKCKAADKMRSSLRRSQLSWKAHWDVLLGNN